MSNNKKLVFIMSDKNNSWFLNKKDGSIISLDNDGTINHKWYIANPPSNNVEELNNFCSILDYATSVGITRKVPVYAIVS